MKTISVITACYNEVGNVEELYNRVRAVMASIGRYNYEHIFIDNASQDGTAEVLRRLAASDPNVKVIVNARNFGHIRSPMHAFTQARGDAVIVIVADLQDPPEMIADLLQGWEEGYSMVLCLKRTSEEHSLMFWMRKRYYALVNRLSSIETFQNFTGFGLYDRRVVDLVKSFHDPYPYFRGMIAEIGLPHKELYYNQPARKRGITKNNFYTLYDIGMLGIINHSKVPLRLMTFTGFGGAILSFVFGLGYLAYKLLFWRSFSVGIAPLVIGMFFVSSILLVFMGVMGEYIGAIHTQIQQRPYAVELERINFEYPLGPPRDPQAAAAALAEPPMRGIGLNDESRSAAVYLPMRDMPNTTSTVLSAGGDLREIGSRVHVNALDGIRGFAFLMVYFYHFGFTRPFRLIHEGAWAGVDLFLVLSGFLITGILVDTRGHSAFFKNFYARRTLRIFPLYYAVLLFFFLLTPVLHIGWSKWEIAYPLYASNIALHFSNIGQHPQFDIQHLWSLALEEQFYLLWPLVIWRIEDRKKLISICGGVIAFSLIARSLLALQIVSIQHPYDFNYVMLPTRMDTLVAGGLVAILIRCKDASRWLFYVRESFWLWLALLVAMLAITRNADLHNPLVNTAGFSLIAALFASLIARVLVTGSVVERLFQFSWLRSIGKYSYGMYVFHEIFRPSIPQIPHVGVWLDTSVMARILFFPLWLIAIYCIAWLSYNFFELRFIRMKRYFPYHVDSTDMSSAAA